MKKNHQLIQPHSQIMDYIIGQKIGQGAFGEIYSAIDVKTGLIWAIKTEPESTNRKTLRFEYQILARVQSSPTFPRLGILGKGSDFTFLSMELLGPSLSTILKLIPGGKFSFSTAIRASYHILKCIEALHIFGYIHRDLKPGNILTREGTEYPLCLIDFGLSRMYINPTTGKHLPNRDKVGFRGTRAYASINAHNLRDLSRRDDLISWFYIIYEFIIEPLPWRKVENKVQILTKKENFDVASKVSPVAPELFEIWRSINSLKFEDTPCYSHIYDCLLRICRRCNISMNEPFDWADIIHENRNKIAQTVENIRPNKKQIKAKTDPIEEYLLTPYVNVPSPFSHASENDSCSCC